MRTGREDEPEGFGGGDYAMMLILWLALGCAFLGLFGPRGLALAALILGTLFAAAVAARVGWQVAF